jgi:hypothetical protein
MREEEQKLNSNKGNSIERNYGKDIINEFFAVNLGGGERNDGVGATMNGCASSLLLTYFPGISIRICDTL